MDGSGADRVDGQRRDRGPRGHVGRAVRGERVRPDEPGRAARGGARGVLLHGAVARSRPGRQRAGEARRDGHVDVRARHGHHADEARRDGHRARHRRGGVRQRRPRAHATTAPSRARSRATSRSCSTRGSRARRERASGATAARRSSHGFASSRSKISRASASSGSASSRRPCEASHSACSSSCHAEVEADAELAEDRLGAAEAAVDASSWPRAASRRARNRAACASSEAVSSPGGSFSMLAEQLLDAAELAELEGGLDRLHEVRLDVRARARQLLAVGESPARLRRALRPACPGREAAALPTPGTLARSSGCSASRRPFVLAQEALAPPRPHPVRTRTRTIADELGPVSTGLPRRARTCSASASASLQRPIDDVEAGRRRRVSRRHSRGRRAAGRGPRPRASARCASA